MKFQTVFAIFVATVSAHPSPLRNWQIIGGDTAADGQFPYQISLRSYGSHNCGGSIISDNVILTAAHCVVGGNPKTLTVVAGTNKLSTGGDTYQAIQLIANEKFDRSLLQNDVALVQVDGPITFNSKVTTISLNTNNIGGDADVVLSGWGRIAYPGDLPDDLQFINLKSVTNEYCNERHQSSGLSVSDSQICTFTKSGQGACHGDSGGPLVYEGNVAGIVSWGRPCAVGYPDVYTRVSSFVSWIEDKEKELREN